MARGKKKKAPTAKKKKKAPAAKKSRAKAAEPERDSAVDAVSELVSVLACPQSALDQLALSCEEVLDQADVSCGFARFITSTWSNRGATPYHELDAVARELVAEYERHITCVADLLDRLTPLVQEGDHADHEDLDPMDVFKRIEPMLAAEAAQ